MSGRIAPGVGTPLTLPLVVNALAANTDPTLAPTVDTWECTLGGSPAIGDEAEVVIGLTNYGYVVSGVLPEIYGGQLGSAPGAGDIIHTNLKVGGVTTIYDVECTPGMTLVQAAQAVEDACNLGSYDIWKFVFGGGNCAGGEDVSITLGSNTYHYICGIGDTPTLVCLGLKNAAAGDPNYTLTNFTVNLKATKIARGTGLTVSVDTTAAPTTHTDTHEVTGQPAQTNWVALSNGVSLVSFTFHTDGALNAANDAVSGSVTLGTGTVTYVVTETQAGTNTSNATLGTAIAAAITGGDADYTAAYGANVVTVTARVAGPPVRTVSSLYTPSLGTGTFVAVNTIPGAAGFSSTAGSSIRSSRAGTGSVDCFLNAGTSYVLEIWTHDPVSNTWLQDLGFGSPVINGSGVLPWTVSGDRVYAYVHTFVGGGDATVTVKTPN